MLLRSSSTPILGSLLSSSPFFSESPNNNSSRLHHRGLERSSSSSSSPAHDIASHQPNPSLRCHFSPHSDSSDRDPSSLGFRRARSEGSLKSILPPNDSLHHRPPAKFSSSVRRANPILESIPSFSMDHSRTQEEEPREDEEEGGGGLKRSITVGESIAAAFCFSGENRDDGLDENSRKIGYVGGNVAAPLYLARGLGIDRLASGILNAGSGGGGSGRLPVRTGYGREQSDLETYYKRMVDENPGDALFLRNYAQFLYQTKGDPQRAEEYYSRAIIANPSDGEILSQYAQLLWEQHHDEERACSYFEQAVQATPHDSHVLAAYAQFLWEAEDNEVESGEGSQSQNYAGASIHHGAFAC